MVSVISKHANNHIPIITIVGSMGSGKGTLAEIIKKELGFQHFAVSEILREEAIKRNILTPRREDLYAICVEMQEKQGKAILAKLLFNKIVNDYKREIITGAIIDGFRYFIEVEYMKYKAFSTIIWLEAKSDIRFERLLTRKKIGDILTKKDFQERESIENSTMIKMKDLADIVIENNGSREEFKEKAMKSVQLFQLN